MATKRRERREESILAGEASAAAAEVEAALEIPQDPTAAAFFDVDNTIMQGASIFHLARGLYARKFFTAADIARWGWEQAKFRVLDAARANELAQARRVYASWRLVLGLLHARAGLLDEAEREFRALREANPNSELAHRLLKQVRTKS